MATGAALVGTSHVERESNPDPRPLPAHQIESFPTQSHKPTPENNRYPYVLLAVCRPVETISSYSVIKPIHDPAGSKMVAVGGRHPRNPKTPARPPRPRKGSQHHFAGIDHLTPCQPHHHPAPSITRFESRSSSPTGSPDRILRTNEAKVNHLKTCYVPM